MENREFDKDLRIAKLEGLLRNWVFDASYLVTQTRIYKDTVKTLEG